MPSAVFYNSIVLSLGALAGYLGFSGVAILILLSLMAADTVLGIKCAKVRRTRFKSRRLNGGIYGKAAAIAILFAFAFAVKAAVLSLHQVDNIEHLTGVLIGVVVSFALGGELYSITRNLIYLTTGRLLPEWHVWIFLIRVARERAEKFVYGKK